MRVCGLFARSGPPMRKMIKLKFCAEGRERRKFECGKGRNLNKMLCGHAVCENELCKACSAGEGQIKRKSNNVCANVERKIYICVHILPIGSHMWEGRGRVESKFGSGKNRNAV